MFSRRFFTFAARRQVLLRSFAALSAGTVLAVMTQDRFGTSFALFAKDAYYGEDILAHAFPNRATPCKLIEADIPKDSTTGRFRFQLPEGTDEFYLPVCSTLLVTTPGTGAGGRPQRLYTPVTPNGTKGYFDIVVRNHGGMMSNVFWNLKPGNELMFKRQPTGVPYGPNRWKHVVLVAGGIGITPIKQVIDEIMRNPADRTKVSLVYANRWPRDAIFLREFEKLAAERPDRFTFVPVFSRYGIPDKDAPNPDGPLPRGALLGHVTSAIITTVAGDPKASGGESLHFFVSGSDRFVQDMAGVPMTARANWSSGRPIQPFSTNAGITRSVGTESAIIDAGFSPNIITAF